MTTTTKTTKDQATAEAGDRSSPPFKQAAASFEQAGQAASLVRDQTATLIKLAEQLTVDAVRKAAGTASELATQGPDLAAASYLSDFHKTIEAGIDVSEQLLNAQRNIANAVFEAWAPKEG